MQTYSREVVSAPHHRLDVEIEDEVLAVVGAYQIVPLALVDRLRSPCLRATIYLSSAAHLPRLSVSSLVIPAQNPHPLSPS